MGFRMDILKKKQLFKRDKTRFCENGKIHSLLLQWMESKDFILILEKPVWIVPHSYLKDKIAIYPHEMVFMSENVPDNIREIVVLHEIEEHRYEGLLGIRAAHRLAIVKELIYVKQKKIETEYMRWVQSLPNDVYKEMFGIWDVLGLTQVRQNVVLDQRKRH